MTGHDEDEKKNGVELDTIEKVENEYFDAGVNIENREALEKVFVRKLDFRLMPLMMLICMHPYSILLHYEKILTNGFADILNYLDRNNIATARLGTLEDDIGLEGNQYNTVISM